jgi:hypothetical protein
MFIPGCKFATVGDNADERSAGGYQRGSSLQALKIMLSFRGYRRLGRFAFE